MPDENKFEKLRTVGYRIPGNCGLCKHGQFPGGNLWGQCGLHTYDHGKHIGAVRGVSIVQIGTCPSFTEDPTKISGVGLGAHEEFLPGRSPQELPPSQGRKQKPGRK